MASESGFNEISVPAFPASIIFLPPELSFVKDCNYYVRNVKT
jgi:hypothetical protein